MDDRFPSCACVQRSRFFLGKYNSCLPRIQFCISLVYRKLYEYSLCSVQCRVIAQAVSRRLPTAAARVRVRVRSCGICGGQSGTGAGFPCQFSFHRLPHIHNLSFCAGKIGQIVADVPSRLSLTPPTETKIKLCSVL
jgi:hypothetical protein